MNYIESKKVLDTIAQKYNCKGEIIFRAAIQNIIECGQQIFRDDSWFAKQLNNIDNKHDQAESEGKILFCTRDFEKAILECSKEIAEINAYDFLMYIQREVWLGGGPVGEPDYQRAIELLKHSMSWIEAQTDENAENLDTFEWIGFTDDEIEHFGYGYLFEEEE